MKIQRLLFLLMFTITFLCYSFGQSIVAGISDGDDYYYSCDPDIVLSAYTPINSASDSVFIDANGDGTDDFKIFAYHDNNGQWGQVDIYSVEPLMDNEVLMSHVDSCTTTSDTTFLKQWTMAKSHDYGDTILINDNWVDSTVYMSYTEIEGWVNGGGFFCGAATFGYDTTFLGIKVHTATDTLYGWIRLKKVGGALKEIIIDDYACNLFTVSLDEINAEPSFVIYPNPVQEVFTISSSITDDLEIRNLNGTLITSLPLIPGENSFKNLNLASGMYILSSVKNGTTVRVVRY